MFLSGAGLLWLAVTGWGQEVTWQIGKPGERSARFALGPDKWAKYSEDGWFVVGESNESRDWPYVQPGPIDTWAGSKAHTFTIQFGLKNAPAGGDYTLKCGFLDAHHNLPPELRIQVNALSFDRKLTGGTGDESIHGDPTGGKKQEIAITVPASALQKGDNAILITSVKGCWALYDYVKLEGPKQLALTEVKTRTVVEDVKAVRALRKENGNLFQPITVRLRNRGGRNERARVELQGLEPKAIELKPGVRNVELLTRPVQKAENRTLQVAVEGQSIASRTVRLQPVKPLTVYILPHSHTDIGYTEIQTAIEKKQVNNLVEGIAAARRTAGYPEGARFVWNVEVLWAADLYLHRLSPAQQAEFRDAVQKGWVALNGMYLNELTGLCRPEELVRLFRYATQLSDELGVKIDAAMISDVPGYTWGTVTAMNQAGIRYFSVAPNYFDRIGDILQKWENKPFYWVSPSGGNKVLVWIPFRGYAMSHVYKQMTPEFVASYQMQLEQSEYPYEISYLRWSGHGDNAVPDPAICEFIKDWNRKYAYPKFVIASTSDAFRAFEARYAKQIPEAKGDWTPYWEDGAGSSALETAMNRATAERLTQAEALWAIRNVGRYPGAEFDEAWNKALLYSEHTWGASMSVSDPENPKTKEQWEIKRGYALEADRKSRELLALAAAPFDGKLARNSVDVFNTTSSERSQLVRVPKELSAGRDHVVNGSGTAVPSQRLASGELAFYAQAIPAFAGRRFALTEGSPVPADDARAGELTLDNGLVHVRLDPKSGGIAELLAKGMPANLADTNSGHCLNDYLFLAGSNVTQLQTSGQPVVTIKESGPLVASLLVQSEAPGCRKLTREIRLEANADYVEVIDTVDKERAAIPEHPGDWHFAQTGGKESVNFAFCFNVPDGQINLDIPLAVMQPEIQQIAGSCKNWFTVSRWLDIANDDFGITWVTMDAPLVELGGVTANLLGSQGNPEVWRKKVDRTQQVYSWVMNNHWGTNYRSYQEGPTVFRYILRPHKNRRNGRASDLGDAGQFALGFTQPLLVLPASGPPPASEPRLKIDGGTGVVASLKPGDDGKALIVRLFGSTGQKEQLKLNWSEPKPKSVWLSGTSEKPKRRIASSVEVPGYELITVRAEL